MSDLFAMDADQMRDALSAHMAPEVARAAGPKMGAEPGCC